MAALEPHQGDRAPAEVPMFTRRGSSMSSFELDAEMAAFRHTRGSSAGYSRHRPHGSAGGQRTLRQQQLDSFATSRGMRTQSDAMSIGSASSGIPSPTHGGTRYGGANIVAPGSAIRRGPPPLRAADDLTVSGAGSPGTRHITFDDEPDARIAEVDLPAPLLTMYETLCLDLREPEDDFDTTLRKIVVSVGVPLVVFPISFAIYVSTQVAIVGVTAGAITALLIMFVFPLVWIPSYIYVRQTRQTPDTLMDAWLVVTIAAVGFLALSLIQYPVLILAFFLAAISIMCHTPLLWLELVLCGIVYLLSAYNYAIETGGTSGESEAGLAALPNPYRGTILERVAYQFTAFVIGLIIISALMMQMREHVRHITAARVSAEMSKRVATELQRYNTEGVHVLLQQYSTNADHYLVETFANIADNLELFRPHLPNWMLLSLNGLDEDPDGFGATGGADDTRSTSSRMTASSARSLQSIHLDNMSPKYRSGARGGSSRQSDLLSNRTGSGFSLRDQYNYRGENLPKVAKGSEGKSGGGGRRQSVMSRGGRNNDSHHSPVVAVGPKPFRGTVTYAMLEVMTADDLGLRRLESISTRFVDRVHQAAAETTCAVHTFVGDTVHASWNTATRVAIPEVKACRFVANLIKDSGDAAVSVQGAIMTGEARSYLAGTKQTALTVSFRWRDALTAAAIHARKRNAVYVCPQTFKSARDHMFLQGVAAIRVRKADLSLPSDLTDQVELSNNFGDAASPASAATLHSPLSPSGSLNGPSGGSSPFANSRLRSTRVVALYQLFRERGEREVTGDDWLYVVDENDRTAVQNDSALLKALKGDFVGALDDIRRALDAMRKRIKERQQQEPRPDAPFEECVVAEAAWVEEEAGEDGEEEQLRRDPQALALLAFRRRIDELLRRRGGASADDFPEDMSQFF